MSYQVFKKGRGGSTFKPSGGIAARPARPAPAPQQPTPSSPPPRTRDSSSPQAEERRNRRRLEEEIRRAENLAAGLPEDAVPESAPDYAASGRDQSYRRPIDDDDESQEPRRTGGRPDDRDRREDERGDALRRNDEGERDEAGADRDVDRDGERDGEREGDSEAGRDRARGGRGRRGRSPRRRGRGRDSDEAPRGDREGRGEGQERAGGDDRDEDSGRRDDRSRAHAEPQRSGGRDAARKVREPVEPEPKVSKEVIISAEPLESRVAVLEDSRLEEFTVERTNDARLVGSIYKGKVKNLEDNLKAAFVDIGFEKNAFLHYWDIVPSSLDSNVEIVERHDGRARRNDKPKFTQKDVPRLFPPGSEIIVQVTKDAIGTKGPRVTTNLSLPGRYLVLLPNSDQSGISRKIESGEERQRLKKIVRELSIPEGMGVIVRTAGEGKLKRYFIRDLAMLLEEWKEVQQHIKEQPLATCVFQEPDLIERTVRDFLTEDVTRIVIDNHGKFEYIRDAIARISKRSSGRIHFYNEAEPLFDRFNITRQLESAFSRQVSLKSGGYLVIDETEALVAVDVNTGKHKGGKDHDSAILRVNLEAADEICRQLRLRNMGGIIVLDFIDMRSRRDQQQVYQRVKEGLRRDKAKTHVLALSPLGLMEMTRQRQTESVQSSLYEDCVHCRGRGFIKSAETMSVEIQRKLTAILKARPRDDSDFQVKVVCNPRVLDRLRTRDERLLIDLEKRFFAKLTFRPDGSFHNEQWIVYNALTNDEIARAGIDEQHHQHGA
jgi:ribonuclease G